MEVLLAVFHGFGSFSSYLCTFDSTHWGFYVLNSFSCLGSSFCGFYRLWTAPINGVFAFIYDSTILHSIEALKSLFLLLNCVFRINKLGFFYFWCSGSDLKCLILLFWCLANSIALIPWRNWNETMRLLVIFGIPFEIASVSGCV